MIITDLRSDASDNIATIEPDEIITTSIIISENINVIFKADPIIFWIFTLSKSGSN